MKTIARSIVAIIALAAAVPAAADSSPQPAAAAAAKLSTQDTTIGDLLANAAAKAVIDKHIPGFSDNPQIGMASGMTLRAIQPMAGDKITTAMLNAVDADLAKIHAK